MIYVASELHGYPLEKFEKLLKNAGFSDDDFLYILGDVIDRGDEGVEILKWLAFQDNAQLILGNHEAMMLACDFLFEEITEDSLAEFSGHRWSSLQNWRRNGGETTINALSKESQSVRKFILKYLRSCPLYQEITVGDKKFLLVHSGLGGYEPNKKMEQYTAMDLLWTRPDLEDVYSQEYTTIFGHTPTGYYGGEYNGRVLTTPTWIDIDVGCARGLPPVLLRLDDMMEFYGD